MEKLKENQMYYYETKEDGSIRLLRCFGESPYVIVPDRIEGRPVTEIGSYCFAASSRLKEKCLCSGPGVDKESMTELAGLFLRGVMLPETIEKVDAYAFYGCRKLKELTFGKGIRSLENDVFMNCTGLSHLYVRAAVTDVTVLRSVLGQISWNVEARFLEDGACFFFQEYLEYYDELGPAHVFELQVEGEGFRARKSFRGEVFNPGEYDTTFPKASVEEKPDIACRMALARFLSPLYLLPEDRDRYRDFLIRNPKLAADQICFSDREQGPDLNGLDMLFSEGVLGQDTMEYLVEQASEREMAELTAALIGLKRKYLTAKKKSRYSFDDF